MFDFGIGTSELLIVAIVALLVVGPKDLPKLLRSIGHFTTKIRGMAREFQGHLNEAMKETGVDEVRKEVSKATDFSAVEADFKKQGAEIKKAVESATPKFDAPELEPDKPAIKAPEAKPVEKPVEAVNS